MKKFKIIEVLNFNTYILENDNTQEEVVLEFYEVEKPKVGDFILMHENLLNKHSMHYSQPLSFELADKQDAQLIEKMNNEEYAVLYTQTQTYSLKRIYG